MNLNLARRPFVNSRPITRLAVLLWLAGGALAVWNGLEIWRLTSSLGERRRALAAAEVRAAEGQARIAALQAELRDIDLLEQNEETAFLNREIDRRTLSWTGLFQRLGEVLPRQVRLIQIVPSLASPAQRRRPPGAATAAEGWISLSLSGYAENDEALLDFVDTLFAHPSFDAPDLEREAVPPGEPLQFELKVSYLSREAPAVPALSAAADRPAGPSAASGPAAATAPAVAPGVAGALPREASTDRSVRPAAAAGAGPSPAPAIAAAGDPSDPAEPGAAAADPDADPSRAAESTARWSPRAGRATDSGGSAGPAGLPGDWSGPAAGTASGASTAPAAGGRRGTQPVPLGAAASPTRRLR